MTVKSSRKDRSYSGSSHSSTRKSLPWCSGSSAKLTERRKLSPNWETQYSYPLRENSSEYLNNSENLKLRNKSLNRKTNKSEKRRGRKMKLVLLIFCVGIIGYYILYPTESMNLWNKMVSQTITFLSGDHLLVSEECCHKMKHLATELSRKQRLLRNSRRAQPRPVTTTPAILNPSDYIEVDYIEVSIGEETAEWLGQRVKLWGVFPLWHTTPSPYIVRSLERPKPGDCWPFSGRRGSLNLDLPGYLFINRISLEHVRPDKALSAPKKFEVHGVRYDFSITVMLEGVYRTEGPALQYFTIQNPEKVIKIIFHVDSNHGNPNYTCVYRLHLYSTAGEYYDNV